MIRILQGLIHGSTSLALLLFVAVAGAYETETHRLSTEFAFDRSVLNAGYLEQELGLPTKSLLQAANGETLEPRAWLGVGSVREDDVNFFSFAPLRFRHHFYDPVYDRGLTGVITVGRRAFEWALEEPDEIVGQSFSWTDGRRYFLDALTATAPKDREAAMALTFRALGQVTHLVQDMGVPEHTRNDWHAGILPPDYPVGTPSVFEKHVDEIRLRLNYSGYTPPRFQQVRHFWTTGDGRGLAEFTNRNFVSKDTNFTLAVDGNTGRDNFGNPYPSPQLDLARRLDVDLASPDVPACAFAAGLSGKVTFFGNDVNDLVTGDVVRNEFLTTYSVFDNALQSRGQPGIFSVNFCTVEAAAAILLPRATGYSAALIDYFFRGRLDVDLVDDGSGLRLVGANASREALDGGTLTVYADGTDGVRRPASAETGVGRVESGNMLPAVAVAPSEGAERFVAVYTGALGEEGSAGTFPGAVIGKVLGGYRVEELFSDGARWNLRTPQGIFPLPILRIDIVELRWGDADNTLVGRTAFGTGQPNKLRAYQLNRSPGSVDVPLRAATGGGQEVDVQQTAEATFPIGVDVGGLQLNSTIDYQQYLISFIHTTVYSQGVLVSDTYSDGQAERVVNGSASTTFDWRLTLDLPKFNNFRARPYLWQLQQIGLTADGRLVALVRIRLTQLDPSLPESFGVFPSKRFVWCGQAACSRPPAIQDGPPAWVPYGFGRGAQNHWTLVDVTQGRVVYSTAADGVVINNTIHVTRFRESGGGPFQGLVAMEIPFRTVDGNSFYAVDPQDNLRFASSCNPPAGSGFYEVSRVELAFGVSEASARQYRPELARTEFPPFAEHLRSQEKACLAAAVGPSPFAFVEVASDEARVYLNDAPAAFRVPDGSGRVALLFILGQALATNFRGDHARVVGWDPLAQSATLRHEVLTGDLWQLTTAAHGVAVIGGINSPALTAVPLEGNQPATAFPMTLGNVFNFRALSPAFLYNVQDQKFYRYQPGLLKTALPATLAAGGSAAGDYHAVRLP